MAAVPVVRSSGSLPGVTARLALAALVILLAALVLGSPRLVPLSLVLAVAGYETQLAWDDAPLDAAAPVLAAGLYLVAELAYWSLEERDRAPGDPGEGLRRAAFVAALGAGALVMGASLLALVDAVQAQSLAFDVLGAAAAAAVLAAIVLVSHGRGRTSE